MREFNYTITQALSTGLRASDKNKRNSQALVLSDGVYPDEGALSSLEELSPIDCSSISPTPEFPYPQIFELLKTTLVCTKDAIYSYALGTLTLELGGLAAGHRWSAADFGHFIVLANEVRQYTETPLRSCGLPLTLTVSVVPAACVI